ncbi:MAG: gamma-glutamylcyclotransferase [Gammaproteobacteria bacterium]|nr:MAG: gamma-glutamylcyclotransferase [Gammaproteobacteria bacterium]
MNDRLFVYGTLLPGSPHPLARRLAAESDDLGPAQVPGLLYDLGGYPGLRHQPGTPARVQGRLLRLHDPGRSLPWLDAYEGCSPRDPRPHEYRRVELPVQTAQGDRVTAWAWLWQGLPRGRLIAGGDWLASVSRGES